MVLKDEFQNSEDLITYLDSNFSSREHFETVKTILKVAFDNNLLPNARSKKAKADCGSYLDWFFTRYKNAKEATSLQRIGKPMGTS